MLACGRSPFIVKSLQISLVLPVKILNSQDRFDVIHGYFFTLDIR